MSNYVVEETHMTLEYASYLVRLWRDQDPASRESNWQGEIEHIQSGERWMFESVDELFTFLHRRVDRLVQVNGFENGG
jgi:hypothetical protein